MKETVCITGVAGLIGSWIAEALIKKGYRVIGFDNLIGGYADTISFLEDVGKSITEKEELERPYSALSLEEKVQRNIKNFEYFYHDISWYEGIEHIAHILKKHKVKAVYHCAAIAPEGYSVFAPSIISNSVFMGTTVMATAAIRAGIKRFINLSSMSRYGNQESPFIESMNKMPIDPYALAKSSAEDMATMLGKMHGMEVVHAIPHNVVGPRQSYTDPYRNVVSIMTNLMLQGRQPIIYGDGSQSRCFSMIQDDVEIFVNLLDCEIEHGESFNIGPDNREISILNLAKLIASILNFDLDPIFETSRPHEVMHPICSSNKIRERFGFIPKMSLEDGIKSIVDYIQKRGALQFNYHLPIEINNKENIPKTWKERKF